MTKKKRIGYIFSMKKGILRFIYRELSVMEKKGHKIFIFPTKLKEGKYNPKDSWQVIFYNKLLVLLLQPLYLFKNPKQYLSLLFEAMQNRSVLHFMIGCYYANRAKSLRLDIIHCHFGDHKLFIGYYMKRFLGTKLTVTIHAHELYRNPNDRMFKHALKACDNIITISEYNKKYLVDKFDVDGSKIQTIRLFVEEDEISAKKRKVLVVGSFEERKGYDVLIEAIRKLVDEDCIFWIVGEGHMDIPAMAKKAGVDDKIKFMGHLHADILDVLFDSCDIFCLPAKTAKVEGGIDCEGIPVVLMEAMIRGKPVVTTRHVGIPELVEEVLVDEDNAEQLASALRHLFHHPEMYADMGRKNRAIIKKDYSIKNVDKLEKIFTSFK